MRLSCNECITQPACYAISVSHNHLACSAPLDGFVRWLAAFEEVSAAFADTYMVGEGEGMLFKTNENRGKAPHGKVVAKAILLATFQGCILPHLKMPMYLWCSAFDKIHDWYCDDTIYAELVACMLHRLNVDFYIDRTCPVSTCIPNLRL